MQSSLFTVVTEGGRGRAQPGTVLTLQTAALAFSLLDDHSSDFQNFLNLVTGDFTEDITEDITEDWSRPHREIRRERNLNCAKLFPECKV